MSEDDMIDHCFNTTAYEVRYYGDVPVDKIKKITKIKGYSDEL